MSDYLTNLVSRSFSSLASGQPRTTSLTAAPEVFESSVEKFSDPFAEAEKSSDEDSALSEELTKRKVEEGIPRQTETSLGDSPRLNETSIGAPLTSRSSAITPRRREEREDTVASARVHGRSNQPTDDDTSSKAKQARRKPGTIAPPIIDVSLTSSEKPPELTPLQETGAPLSNLGPHQGKVLEKEELNEAPPGSSGIAPLIRSAREAESYRAARLSKPFDSENSIEQLQKNPGKPGSLSPQTLAAHLMPPLSGAVAMTQSRGLNGSFVETTVASADSQVRTSPSTLIPKVQPPLLISVNARPNSDSGQVPFETEAQPLTETIVNVAIGRIEVRATPFESPKREQQSKGPKVMNLDDYMQQRSRGNR